MLIKKIINIFGCNGVGKSVITVLLADIFAEKKIKVLIIDANFNDYSIYKIFNKMPEKRIVNIDNISLSNKYSKIEAEYFNIIIFDNPNINFLKTKDLLKDSTNIFLSECNLLGIKKISRLINRYTKEIKKESIRLIFNKYNSNSIDKEILYKIFKSIKILGIIKYTSNIDIFINSEKLIKIKAIRKDLLEIAENLLKENKKYGYKHTERDK